MGGLSGGYRPVAVSSVPLPHTGNKVYFVQLKHKTGILLSELGRKSCFLLLHHSSPVNYRDPVHLVKYVWWSRMLD